MAEPEFTIEELESEEWRAIPSYEGIYSVSNLGRIRTDKSRARCYEGSLRRFGNARGYAVINLYNGTSYHHRTVHSIVLLTFVGPRPIDYQVNHKDGDKRNNRLTNLEYLSAGDNTRHAVKLGLFPMGDRHYARRHPEWLSRGDRSGARLHPETRCRGDKHWTRQQPTAVIRGEQSPNAILTNAQIPAIRKAFKERGESIAKIIKRFGISRSQFYRIGQRKSWKHID